MYKHLNNVKDTHSVEFTVIVAAFVTITILEFLTAFTIFDSVQEISRIPLLI